MLLWILACTGEPAVETPLPLEYSGVADNEENSAVVSEPLTSDDIALLEGQLQHILDAQMTMTALPILAAQQQVFAYTDSTCPSSVVNNDNLFWVGYCTASTGLYLNGYLFYNSHEQTDLYGDGNLWDMETLSGSMDAILPDGTLVHWGGGVNLGTATTVDGHQVFFTSVSGSFLDEHAQSDWLRTGLSTDITVYGAQYPVENDTEVYVVLGGDVDASMLLPPASDDSLRIVSIGYRQVSVLGSLFAAYHCIAEPLGTLEMRLSDGRWVEVVFDVIQEENGLFTTPEGECDGCGDIRMLGSEESLGEMCIDPSGLTNFSSAPWEGQ